MVVVVPESEAEEGSVVVPEEEGACTLTAVRDLRVRGMVTAAVVKVLPKLKSLMVQSLGWSQGG